MAATDQRTDGHHDQGGFPSRLFTTVTNPIKRAERDEIQ
jgi:hypothetical protein